MRCPRDVAIVAFAQTTHRRSSEDVSETEMLLPVLREVLDRTGLAPGEAGFTCSGSSDYLAGRPFSFTMTLDAVGAWPPVAESHVETDGAWALYEAWVELLTGGADTALVHACGKSSAGDLDAVLTRQLDPYCAAPLWPDPTALAALQAQALIDAGESDEQALAAIADRNRTAARANPYAQLRGPVPMGGRRVGPLRTGDCPPVGDGAAAVVLAAGDTARRMCERPAWIRGLDHRIDPQGLGLRDLTDAPSARLAAEHAGAFDASVDTAEIHAPFTAQEVILRKALRLGDDVTVNPSGGALAANPVMATGLIRFGEAAARIHRGESHRALAHATSGPCLQQNLVGVLEGEGR